MISFPKYQTVNTVLKAVKANTAKDEAKLPTIAYIGFTEPAGAKTVFELNNQGEVIETSGTKAKGWLKKNAGSLSLMLTNLTTAHGEMPANVTLTLIGYVNGDQFTLVDGQLAADGKHSAYWLTTAVLNQLVERVGNVKTAFSENALYAEIDFNDVDSFLAAADKIGEKMLWQVSPHSEFANALVLRDPYRIAL